MRLPSGRRRPAPEQVEAARARVSTLSRRAGWVPRVPDTARPMVEPEPPAAGTTSPASQAPSRGGRHARRASDADRSPGSAPRPLDRLSGVADDVPVDVRPAEPLAPTEPSAVPIDVRPAEPAASVAPGYGRLSGAVADRLPLPIRALAEGLPAGVRNGQLELQPRHALVVVLVILLGLAATALAVGWGRPKLTAVEPGPVATVLATGTPVAGPGAEPDARAADPEEVVVHVAGEVARPGIVELPFGSRVVDAIEAAGGFAADVDLTTLNLARIVADGEQIFVGVDPPPGATAGAAPVVSGGLVSLNTATPEQLATLPGIGPALADRIVQWREQHGRFTAVEELLEVSGIGPAKYEALAELVTP